MNRINNIFLQQKKNKRAGSNNQKRHFLIIYILESLIHVENLLINLIYGLYVILFFVEGEKTNKLVEDIRQTINLCYR